MEKDDRISAIVKKLDEASFEKFTEVYAKVEKDIKAREAAFDDEMKERRELLKRIKSIGIRKLDKEGVKSMKTGAGSIQVVTKPTYGFLCKETFIEWVAKTGSVSMLQTRVSGPEVKSYIEEHDGDIPPGIRISNARIIRLVPKRGK